MATTNCWNNQVLAANVTFNGGTMSLGTDSTDNAINIGTAASAGRTVTIGNATGTSTIAINCGTGGITVGTSANAHTSTFGSTNSTSATTVQSGSGALNVTSTNGAITINSGTGTIALSNDGTNTTINLGTGAGAKLVTVGSTNGASSLTEHVGTGNYVLDGVAGSTYTLGASTTTGTITIGGTAQTGTMTLGSSSGTNTLVIAGGSGATTVQIANAQTGGSVAIGAAMTTGTIAIGGTGAQTGTITIGGGTGAQTVNLGTGGTGVKTIHIGDSAVANVITIGSTTGAASLTLQSGSGNVINNTGLTIDSTGRNYNTKQPCFLANKSAVTSNVTGDGTDYTVIFDTVNFDQGSNYNNSTGTFTAPVTGNYQFNLQIMVSGIGAGHTTGQMFVHTTQNLINLDYESPAAAAAVGGFLQFQASCLLPMATNDTATFSVKVSGSTKTVNIYSGGAMSSSASGFTVVSGYLVC